MRVVPVLGLVLDVRRVDRDAARLLLRRRINLVVRLGLATKLLRQHQRDRRRQRRLAMIHVTNRPTFTCGFVRSNLPFAIADS